MLRGVLLVFAMWFAGNAAAQTGQTPAASNWAAVTIPESSWPKGEGPIRVQDPYCEMGVGPCGGTCNEEGGKHWNCLPTALPCYQRGGRCTCEEAGICKPVRR
ncbi:MAG TPA: hypothetical protein VE986_09255 [Hyphomicrobiales bacterium]|nr:hypothetical protein [Hyphomicrobiales bacterium]